MVSIARNQRRERICSLFSIDTESSKLRAAGSSPAAPTMFSIAYEDSRSSKGAAIGSLNGVKGVMLMVSPAAEVNEDSNF